MSQDSNQTKVFFGRLLCGLGIALAVVRAFFVSIATNVLGMVGHALGARRLGTLTITLALFLGQGVMPGAYDRITDGGSFRISPSGE